MPNNNDDKPPQQRLLVMRLNAIGDVAMTIPALWDMVHNHPEYKVVMLSRGFARNFVEPLGEVEFFEADLKGRHKGLGGLLRLYRDLRATGDFDAVVDLHDVLRTKFLRLCFMLSGVRCVKIDKGRSEKRALVSLKNKQLQPLNTTFHRYAATFERLGISIGNQFESLLPSAPLPEHIAQVTGTKAETWIGIAPFAKHRGKIYPQQLMEKLVQWLANEGAYRLFLFGGGGHEQTLLDTWADRYPNVVSLARKLSMHDELQVMAHLDAIITMDSANMHLASLVGTPVVSIWGATHPYAGFYGWNQSPDNAVQIDLPCRPCSVYGNRPCARNDYACLNLISPDMVVERLETVLAANANEQ